ncbi:hypothetical protein MZD04_gp191 [Pseudomonas phage Psa21]|uniref:Uncharacterized protein n=1 Tax=Pseudomonas phage Psa21 TaxID=2530023 RepID=A0A481W626_9CAUD|nr:hypothetical protein MZD04_gp191 [Pseudomonas phage Psa21]QBJ02717.1 hypothetical protein PSA21_191 [Pseudomonas phage Psa21]
MYTILPALDQDTVDKLIALRKELTMSDSTGTRLRIGKNIRDKESRYRYSRWFSWNRHQRAKYKELIPEQIVSRSIQCWFLEFEPEVGFLDTMTYWVGMPSCGTAIAYALQDDMYINLEGNNIHVKKGEGIAFHLSTVHQVNPSSAGGLWACVMTRTCHTTCKT